MLCFNAPYISYLKWSCTLGYSAAEVIRVARSGFGSTRPLILHLSLDLTMSLIDKLDKKYQIDKFIH